MLKRRQFLHIACLGTAAAIAPRTVAFAQGADDYPSREVRIVHQYPPGGSTDLVARIISEPLQEQLGQPFIIESRPGGGGIIGASEVKNAAADGLTILLTISSFSIMPAIYKELPFDAEKDFEPVAQLATLPFVLVASKASGITSVAEIVEKSKASPGSLTCGSVGIGSPHHLATELFNSEVGIELRHIPYKGASEILTEITAGRIDLTFLGPSALLSLIEAGKVTPVAVTGKERSPVLLDVPTVVESGYPEYLVETWYGLLAPAGTPRDIAEKLYQEVSTAMQDDSVGGKLLQQGMVPALKSPQEFGQQIAEEIALWKRVVEERGIQQI